MFSILGDRAASLDPGVVPLAMNIEITKYRFYMAARIERTVILELAATDPRSWQNHNFFFHSSVRWTRN